MFHYARKELRALSEVTDSWVPWHRPAHYPAKEGEGDEGWLVRTEPVAVDLQVPLSVLTELVSHGSPGPLDVNGKPMQKYLSVLKSADAVALLQEARAGFAPTQEGAKAGVDRVWAGTMSSAVREVLVRREQAALRDHLLKGRSQAACDLCGRQLPDRLLVAAHIVPRHQLNETERRHLDRIAMLACLLGCDALFEQGLIAVDDNGYVRDLTGSGSSDVVTFVDGIAGRHCAAHTSATAVKFAEHYANAVHQSVKE